MRPPRARAMGSNARPRPRRRRRAAARPVGGRRGHGRGQQHLPGRGAVRNNFERTVLQPYDLTWTAWVVLWVVWIWQEIETRHVAAEAGISKGTLTGVAATLQRRGLLARRVHPGDGRRVLLTLTDQGSELMDKLFPEFNRAEQSSRPRSATTRSWPWPSRCGPSSVTWSRARPVRPPGGRRGGSGGSGRPAR